MLLLWTYEPSLAHRVSPHCASSKAIRRRIARPFPFPQHLHGRTIRSSDELDLLNLDDFLRTKLCVCGESVDAWRKVDSQRAGSGETVGLMFAEDALVTYDNGGAKYYSFSGLDALFNRERFGLGTTLLYSGKVQAQINVTL